jgi:hypothetical protein
MTDEIATDSPMGTPPTTHRLSDRYLGWFYQAFEKHALGEPINWEIGLALFPNPEVSGQFVPALGLYVDVPGAVLSTTINNAQLLPPYNLTEAMVGQIVEQVIDSLLEARSQQLSAMQEQQTQASRNGQPTPHHGVILP